MRGRGRGRGGRTERPAVERTDPMCSSLRDSTDPPAIPPPLQHKQNAADDASHWPLRECFEYLQDVAFRPGLYVKEDCPEIAKEIELEIEMRYFDQFRVSVWTEWYRQLENSLIEDCGAEGLELLGPPRSDSAGPPTPAEELPHSAPDQQFLSWQRGYGSGFSNTIGFTKWCIDVAMEDSDLVTVIPAKVPALMDSPITTAAYVLGQRNLKNAVLDPARLPLQHPFNTFFSVAYSRICKACATCAAHQIVRDIKHIQQRDNNEERHHLDATDLLQNLYIRHTVLSDEIKQAVVTAITPFLLQSKKPALTVDAQSFAHIVERENYDAIRAIGLLCSAMPPAEENKVMSDDAIVASLRRAWQVISVAAPAAFSHPACSYPFPNIGPSGGFVPVLTDSIVALSKISKKAKCLLLPSKNDSVESTPMPMASALDMFWLVTHWPNLAGLCDRSPAMVHPTAWNAAAHLLPHIPFATWDAAPPLSTLPQHNRTTNLLQKATQHAEKLSKTTGDDGRRKRSGMFFPKRVAERSVPPRNWHVELRQELSPHCVP